MNEAANRTGATGRRVESCILPILFSAAVQTRVHSKRSGALFKRTGTSLAAMYSRYWPRPTPNPTQPPSTLQLGTSSRGPEGKVKVLIKILSTRKAGTNASLLLSCSSPKEAPPVPSTLCPARHNVAELSVGPLGNWGDGNVASLSFSLFLALSPSCVFSLELSFEGLAHFLAPTTGKGGGGVCWRKREREHRSSIITPSAPGCLLGLTTLPDSSLARLYQRRVTVQITPPRSGTRGSPHPKRSETVVSVGEKYWLAASKCNVHRVLLECDEDHRQTITYTKCIDLVIAGS